MFEDNLSFSDTIEIVPTVEEKNDNTNIEKDNSTVFKETQEVEKKQDEVKSNTKDNSEVVKLDFNTKKGPTIVSARQKQLFDMVSKVYVEKYTEYCGIPDFIVNQVFDIDDGKGTTTIEEAIIMFTNIFPNTRDKINSAKLIEEAINIVKEEIISSLYRECQYGFINIPLHSRENLSKKIKNDFENSNFEASLYDYQLMRLSEYIKQ